MQPFRYTSTYIRHDKRETDKQIKRGEKIQTMRKRGNSKMERLHKSGLWRQGETERTCE